MTAEQALAKLKSLGSAQTRKTYGGHGVTGEMFGVKYGDLGKLVNIRKAAAHHRAKQAKAAKKKQTARNRPAAG
jgi:hypothetical protein